MPELYLVIGFCLGALPAGVLAWTLAVKRTRAKDAEAGTAFAVVSDKLQQLHAAHAAATRQVDELRAAHHAAEREKAGLVAELNAERRQLSEKHETALRATGELADANAAIAETRQHAATLAAKLEAEQANLIAQRKLLEDADARLRESFAKLSNESLRHSQAAFLVLAEQKFKTLHTRADGDLEKRKTEIASLLQPVNQQLVEYRNSLLQIETSRQEAYTDLKSQLSHVAATQQNLGRETSQLVQALRKPQGRGRWGEVTLRRLFELAGLADRVSFNEQVSVEADGQKKRPDCIVDLPEGRQVIVDSKAVIDAFLDAADCTDEVLRLAHLKRHAGQVRSRMEELASKNYWSEFAGSTEYVVLFLPGEAFLYAAVEHDATLIEDALTRKVIIASPTSLLGLLKVIEYGWRQKRIEENVAEVRRQGEILYDRVAKLAEHFDRLGGALRSATNAYNETLGSLERSVIPQARRMNEMGVKGKKALTELMPVEEAVRERGTVWKELPIESVNLPFSDPACGVLGPSQENVQTTDVP